jgi:hypothetical protein
MALLFKYLPILTMFSAVGVSFGTSILTRRVSHSGNVSAIKTVFGLAKPLGQAVPILFLIGLAFGLLTAATTPSDFFRPWLLIAYALFAIALGMGGAIVAPWSARVGKAAAMNQRRYAFSRAASGDRGHAHRYRFLDHQHCDRVDRLRYGC